MRDWGPASHVLVWGELSALVAVAAALVLDLTGFDWARWGLHVAALVGAGALFLYALRLTTSDGVPLSGIEVRRIARIAEMVNFEQSSELKLEWDKTSKDGTHVPLDLSESTKLARYTLASDMYVAEGSPGHVRHLQILQELENTSDEAIREIVATAEPPRSRSRLTARCHLAKGDYTHI